MSKNTLFQYWPVVIGEFYNNEHKNLKKDLLNFFKDYEKKNPKGNKQLHDKNYTGNHNLYQSSYNLHQEKNDALHKVLKFIAKSILETTKLTNKASIDQFENHKHELSLNLIETWFIRYNQGGMIYPHNHGNFSWSCVYYVQVGKESEKMNGSTYFMKPYNPQYPSDFGSKYMRNAQTTFKAEEGKLLVFPGFLYHGSHPFSGENDRMIISANSMTELKKADK